MRRRVGCKRTSHIVSWALRKAIYDSIMVPNHLLLLFFFLREACTHTENNKKILKIIFKETQVIYQLVTAV